MKCANCGNEFKGVYCPLCGTVDASYLNAAQAEEKDPLYDFAVEIVKREGQASTSLIQRRCHVRYFRAARIIDIMEAEGVIGPYEGSNPRKVLIDNVQKTENLLSKRQFEERKLNVKFVAKKYVPYLLLFVLTWVLFVFIILTDENPLPLGPASVVSACIAISILGGIAFLVSIGKKLSTTRKAEKLIAEAKVSASLANKAVYFEHFIGNFDSALSSLEELAACEKKIKFEKSPSADIFRLKNEMQKHMRDAIEREYGRIVTEANEKYKNDGNMVIAVCNGFAEDLKKYKDRFDIETLVCACKYIEMAYALCSERTYGLTQYAPAEYLDTAEFSFDAMEGHQFEYFCADLLRKNGFSQVDVTQASGDYGIDVLAEKDDITYAIQCKCYSDNIGNHAVQEAHSGASYYGRMVAVVMTNRYFTTAAKETAKRIHLLLWDRDKIIEMMQ